MQQINATLANLYDAALNAELWPTVLESAARVFGAARVSFVSLSPRPNGRSVFFTHNIDPDYVVAYDTYYHARDSWIIGHADVFGGADGAFAGEMLVPFATLTKSEFYADFMRPQDLHHHLSAVIGVDRANGLASASIGLHRGRTAQPFDRKARELAGMLVPHLRRSRLIADRLAGCETQRQADLSMLDAAPTPIFLVDRHAGIRRMTQAGDSLVRAGRILSVRANRLTTVVSDSRLSSAIECVATAGAAGPFSLALDVYSATRTDRAHLLIARAGPDCPGLVYVAVGPLAAGIAPSFGDRLRQLYGITAAEARLCRHLCQGHSVDAAADLLSIRRSTAVTQLKSVFNRTGVGRQADLVRLLMDIASLR